MKESELLIQGKTLGALQTGTLEVESFLNGNYHFRRNVLNGKVEFAAKPAEEQEAQWRPLTQSALNSIVIRAKREQVCEKGSPKTDIMEYVNSDEIDSFDPIAAYMVQLPQWDGENHVAKLFSRVPGVDSELLGYLATWLRSVVAHWLQMDTVHGNECVPTLIGAQGCGKTTFIVRQGDGPDEQSAGEPGRAGDNSPEPACFAEADALEEQGERTPYLWCLAGRPSPLCLVCGYDEQSASADGHDRLATLYLRDDS